MKFVINGIGFKTKKALHQYVQKIRDENIEKSKIELQSHIDFLFEFVRLHPEYDEKYGGKNIAEFIVKKNPEFGHYVIFARLDDGNIEDIAMNNVIRGRCSNDKENVLSAFRSRIFSQIDEFKKANQFLCELCSYSSLESREFHVDHVVKFKDLVKNFEEINGTCSELKQHTKARSWYFTNLQYGLAWANFHRDNAVLRMLCAKCNLKLPK